MNRPHTLSPGFEPGTNLCSVQNSADSAGHKLVMVTLGEASQDSVPDWNVKYVSAHHAKVVRLLATKFAISSEDVSVLLSSIRGYIPKIALEVRLYR
jgi:hypothetical protein